MWLQGDLDIYPTLADLAGLPLPAHLEGVSVKPVLDDPKRYRPVLWVARNDHSKIDAVEFYDHNLDPQENTTIAKAPGNNELVEKLLGQWRKGRQGAKPRAAAKL